MNTWSAAARWRRRLAIMATGAALIFPMTFAQGCAERSRPIIFAPPRELMAPIAIPDRAALGTVGDMARLIIEDEEAMRLKNADLAALRAYADGMKEAAR